MKLATRYNRINLGVTLAVFLLASATFYILLRDILVYQLDEDLEIEMAQLQAYVLHHGYFPKAGLVVPDQMTHYERMDAPMRKMTFRTVEALDAAEGHHSLFRELSFPMRVGSERYKVTISKALESTGAMMQAILFTAAGTVLLMLLVVTLLNRVVLRRLWAPFYESLAAIKRYRIGDAPLALPSSRTTEFNLLNETLEAATGAASQDYRVLKELTENAAHELQTPLAIIRSKLDLIIQDESLTDSQSVHVAHTYDAVQRLVRLNTSLLLLAKLEGGQFGRGAETVDVRKALEEKLEAFEPHIRAANLSVLPDMETAHWTADPILSDALLNNLLSNAIHHNLEDGHIHVVLRRGVLTVSNTGSRTALDAAGLFTRFYKADAESTRTGLGLAIVRQICEVAGFDVSYRFADGEHQFAVTWQTD